MNTTRLTWQIPMHVKLVCVTFLFIFQAEVWVFVGEYFDFQPACLTQMFTETGKRSGFEIFSKLNLNLFQLFEGKANEF